MSSTKTQLYRIIQRGKILERQGLMEGFESYQDWRNDVINVIDGVKLEFEQLVQTPLHIENGIQWLETLLSGLISPDSKHFNTHTDWCKR